MIRPAARRRGSFVCFPAVALACLGRVCLATDIIGVQPAALDQPRVNALIRYPAPGGTMTDPLFADFGPGARAFNIQAFLDTGASGVLLSNNTAGFLGDLLNPGVQQQTYNGKPVIYEDVGVAGSDKFNVSIPIHISVAASSTGATSAIGTAEEQLSAGNTPSFTGIDLSVYTHTTGPIRTQIGPFVGANPNPDDNPLLADLDILGTPVMKGKVVVMNPKPVENIIGGNIDNGFEMKTHLYSPGTAFKPATADDDPGIPNTTRSIKLSYGSFDAYTRTGALEADQTTITPIPADQVANYRPTLEHNPFIGPNPINPAGDTTPPVKVSFNGKTASGSFLLDTGSAASMISTSLASKLNVRYVPGTKGTDSPQLETFNPANPDAPGTPIDSQFQLSIGGIGGTTKVAGFFLNSMLLRTLQGNAANDNDPKHFRFVDAPVLVSDITVQNPTTQQNLTLDGIFGMNNLVASLFLTESSGGGLPGLSALTPGAFDWVVFDEPSGLLKLRPRLPGDANRDGTVNFADLVKVAQGYDAAVTGTPWESGDFNGDGIVNFADLVTVAQHYDATDLLPGDVLDLPHYDFSIGATQGAPFPEPAGGLLFVACGLTVWRRRGRNCRAAIPKPPRAT